MMNVAVIRLTVISSFVAMNLFRKSEENFHSGIIVTCWDEKVQYKHTNVQGGEEENGEMNKWRKVK